MQTLNSNWQNGREGGRQSRSSCSSKVDKQADFLLREGPFMCQTLCSGLKHILNLPLLGLVSRNTNLAINFIQGLASSFRHHIPCHHCQLIIFTSME
jgi:hypothetical protein